MKYSLRSLPDMDVNPYDSPRLPHREPETLRTRFFRKLRVVVVIVLGLILFVLTAKCVQMTLDLYDLDGTRSKAPEELLEEMRQRGELPDFTPPAPSQPKD